MGYATWFENHAKKHQAIVQKLQANNFTQEEIIAYFDFENMKQKEKDFCPLYAKNQKCHDMKELNCYLCGCPNFRFSDEGLEEYNGKKILSKCVIANGESLATKSGIHQNCTKCTVPHHKSFVQKHFSTNWLEIMEECQE